MRSIVGESFHLGFAVVDTCPRDSWKESDLMGIQIGGQTMQKTKRHPDPLFWINTDLPSYWEDHPDDKGGSAFFRFWLPANAAYFTPAPTEDEYDSVLELIDAGDPIFAYENGKGILALGVVMEKPTLERSTEDFGPYRSDALVKRISVEWDTTVNCSASEVNRRTGYYRRTLKERGTIRGAKDDFLYELRERSPRWAQQVELAREEAANAKFQDIERSQLSPKDRETIQKARIGQGRYRTNLLGIEQRCRVTGISDITHLIASHIKPWTLCEGDEHWDGNNGLLLAPHVDHLFDRGKISFADDGTLLISRFQDRSILREWGLPEEVNVGSFNPQQRQYLQIHRQAIFERTRSWSALRDAARAAPI